MPVRGHSMNECFYFKDNDKPFLLNKRCSVHLVSIEIQIINEKTNR